MKNFNKYLGLLLFTLFAFSCSHDSNKYELLTEDFSTWPRGPLATDVGAHTEYQYIAEARPQTRWTVATFRYNLPPSWEIRKLNQKNVLVQSAFNTDQHWHPLVQTGSAFWSDYCVEMEFQPAETNQRNGMVFRYQNNRCYYFLGIESDSVKLIRVQHEKAFRVPDEVVLASGSLTACHDFPIKLTAQVTGPEITCTLPDGTKLQASDNTFTKGKIGLLSDSPTVFHKISVSCSKPVSRKIQEEEHFFLELQDSIITTNPGMVPYKKVLLGVFGVARNIRFGDLNGDGETDILLGQVVHHGPKDRNSELSCLTAMTLDGEVLWQKGQADPWKTQLTNDVAFQIHDLNQDGNNEVIYCMNQELIVAEGSTGKIIKKISTPLSPGGKPLASGHNIFPRILGDCVFFCDLQGKGYDSDIILKDRYNYVWAYDENLKLLWLNECRTGHYPYACDVNGDGKDELALGYTLFSPEGKKIWSLDKTLSDHADAVALVKLKTDGPLYFLCAASDEGFFLANLEGEIVKHHRIGHVQNPAIANFRNDLPGLETATVNFWGNQGIVSLFNSNGDLVDSFEPTPFGSMCLPLNWNGSNEELYILNANAHFGGAWDGYGRKALAFPDDGHPDMCYAVLDITGDPRDEIVVWNPKELWVYTQDRPAPAGLEPAKPKRNPLYNYSNYQATLSE
jgi:rhamnogalacturonan endolyase